MTWQYSVKILLKQLLGGRADQVDINSSGKDLMVKI